MSAMRSVLTRHVFRRLLANEAFVFECPTASTIRRIQTARSIRPQNVSFSKNQKRTLFGFSRKVPREARDEDLVPGLNVMVTLGLMGKMHARPPDVGKLIEAWHKYFDFKSKNKENVNGVQAIHVLRTFKYLRDTMIESPELEKSSALDQLDNKTLHKARKIMTRTPVEGEDEEMESSHHQAFAREIFEVVKQRRALEGADVDIHDRLALILALTRTGASAEAMPMAESLWKRRQDQEGALSHSLELVAWNFVLKGFAAEGDETALINAARNAEDQGVPLDKAFHGTMTTYYAKKDDVEKTKLWYSRGIPVGSQKPSSGTLKQILKFSLRNEEMDWCASVFRKLLDSKPTKEIWDVILLWAASGLGKGVEEVEHMISVMKEHNSEPDIETFNGLVEYAIFKNDPYLAERYLTVALKHGIWPNAKTCILQMDYRISAGDLSGTHAAYNELQSQDITKNEDVPVINRYIQALCAAPSPNYDRIMSIAAELDQRKVRLTAPTVSALCMLHLARDETQDVLDILNMNVFHHDIADRVLVRDAFLAYIYDRKNDTIRAWEAYTIMRQAFDETDTATRTALMNEFFSRGRSDMGAHVFGHMRQHVRPETRPLPETYVQCFEGIAAAADLESLDMIHNMLKMDSSIDPSTMLYNALMLAYTACSEPYIALDFWTDITNSREGPNYRSLEIVFWVCEGKPFGDVNAKQVWSRMRRMEIEITVEVFTAYVGALAGQALLEECKVLIEESDVDLGVKPDWMTIGVFYNASPGQNRKDEVEEWAKIKFPLLWQELTAKVGQTTQLEGHRLFDIKRNTKA